MSGLIVGIDPGLARCGVAELRAGELHDLAIYGTDRDSLQRDRLVELEHDLGKHILGADVVVIESPSFPKGAVAAAMLWAAYGLVLGLAHGRATVVTFTPGHWRRVLGLPVERRGAEETPEAARRRRKEATERMVLQRFPAAPSRLQGVARGQRDHAYDALAIACAHLDLRARKPAQTTFAEEAYGSTW